MPAPPPAPSLATLKALVRFAMRRGLPAPDAEDVVLRAYERCARSYDPERGTFDALLQRAVQREAATWWRDRGRRPEEPALRVVAADAGRGIAAVELAAMNQRRLLEALTPDERRLFAMWALQRHLPQGQLVAADAARQLGLSVADYDNAKRRLRAKVLQVMASLGLDPRDFYSVADDEGPRPRAVKHG